MPVGAARAGVLGGGALPASVVYQYVAESFASPWPDAIGSADMAISGLTSSTFPNGEDSVAGDGNDDGNADGPQTLPSNETFGLAFTVQYSSAGANEHLTSGRDGSTDFFVRASVSGGSGEMGIQLVDDGGNELAVALDSAIDDNNVHAVIINKVGNSAGDIAFYVDDMTTEAASSVITNQSFDHTNYTNNQVMGFWDAYIDGSANGSNWTGDAGVFEFNEAPYSESEREAFVSRRPEVS